MPVHSKLTPLVFLFFFFSCAFATWWEMRSTKPMLWWWGSWNSLRIWPLRFKKHYIWKLTCFSQTCKLSCLWNVWKTRIKVEPQILNDDAHQDGLCKKYTSIHVQTWTQLKTAQRHFFPATTNLIVWDCYIFFRTTCKISLLTAGFVMGLSYRYNLIV